MIKKLTLLIVTSMTISVNLQAKDVASMDQLLAGLKNDVIMYCKDINLNKDEMDAVNNVKNAMNNNKNSPYRLNNNVVRDEHGSDIMAEQTPQECYNNQTIILDNVFKEYYQRISEKEFISCYNETSGSEQGVLGFEDCIEGIKERECAPILKEKFDNVFDRAKKYGRCLSE